MRSEHASESTTPRTAAPRVPPPLQRHPHDALRPTLAVALLLLLVACGSPVQVPDPEDVSISGTVRLSGGAAADAHEVHGMGGPLAGHRSDAHGSALEGVVVEDVVVEDVVVGEILVLFESEPPLRASASLTVADTTLTLVRPLSLPRAALYRVALAGAAETVALAAALERRADVVAATPNRIMRALLVPNDELYSFMWHLPAIAMPAAWDVTTGSSDVVVAVVDNGVRGRPGDDDVTHPDLHGRLLSGYDFVDRDDDPFDPGTFMTSGSHGTHVAGTIAANADDGVGIAGIDWQAMLLPVRVLDEDGTGVLSDVLDGIEWAAGLPVSGVPANPSPADVINVSLGGGGACSTFEQLVFDRVADAGAIVVVAAGNAEVDASATTPASCANVITVGATRRDGQRAKYSNFGASIDVMAPGGDGSIGPEGRSNGVYSTVHDQFAGHTWRYLQGTSMAAPHVAGVAALLRSLDPTISPAEVRTILAATSVPLSSSACNGGTAGVSVGDCGAGLIDAAAALLAMAGGGSTQLLTFDPSIVEFGSATSAVVVTLRNPSDDTVAWEVTGYISAPSNPGPLNPGLLMASEAAGELPPGGERAITLTIDRSAAPEAGSYRLDVAFDANGSLRELPLFFTVAGAATSGPSLAGTVVRACFETASGCDPARSLETEISTAGTTAPYAITGLERGGAYLLVGWNDLNGNGVVDAGDLFGFHADDQFGATTVIAPADGIDLTLEVIATPAATTERDRRIRSFIERP